MEQLQIGGIAIDYLEMDDVMERLAEFMSNDHLNTLALLSRRTLLRAFDDPAWREYLKRLDLGVICEREILEGADIHEGSVYEAVDRFADRIFWQIVKEEMGVYLLADDVQKGKLMRSWIEESYPGIRIAGEYAREGREGFDDDHLLNAINGIFPDVIVTGLSGRRAEDFIMEHQTKIFGKIWLSLGECTSLQSAAGIHLGWLESRRLQKNYRRLFV